MFNTNIEKINNLQAEIWNIAHHQRDLNVDMTPEYWLLEAILQETNAIAAICQALKQL